MISIIAVTFVIFGYRSHGIPAVLSDVCFLWVARYGTLGAALALSVIQVGLVIGSGALVTRLPRKR
jgi:hypothetical protein